MSYSQFWGYATTIFPYTPLHTHTHSLAHIHTQACTRTKTHTMTNTQAYTHTDLHGKCSRSIPLLLSDAPLQFVQQILLRCSHNHLLRDVGHTPVLLLVGQLQEPLHVLVVVAWPMGREEVAKQTLYQKSDLHVTNTSSFSIHAHTCTYVHEWINGNVIA